MWSKFWKLHVSNKIKIFGWKACQNILPTHNNLVRRKIIEDDTCPLCTVSLLNPGSMYKYGTVGWHKIFGSISLGSIASSFFILNE